MATKESFIVLCLIISAMCSGILAQVSNGTNIVSNGTNIGTDTNKTVASTPSPTANGTTTANNETSVIPRTPLVCYSCVMNGTNRECENPRNKTDDSMTCPASSKYCISLGVKSGDGTIERRCSSSDDNDDCKDDNSCTHLGFFGCKCCCSENQCNNNTIGNDMCSQVASGATQPILLKIYFLIGIIVMISLT